MSTVNNTLIQDKIKLARATEFSLMGTALYYKWCQRIESNDNMTCHMVNIYVVPRLIYRLESQNIGKPHMIELENIPQVYT